MPSNNKKQSQSTRTSRARLAKPMSNRSSKSGLANYQSLRRPVDNKVYQERGTDFLGKIMAKVDLTVTANRIVASGPVSPSGYSGTRVTTLSNLFERFRIRKWRIIFVPAVPNTLACQYVVYQDTDPSDDPTVITDADALIRQATAQTGSSQFNFIHRYETDLARRSDDQFYYTGLDKQNQRFSLQGKWYFIQVTAPVDFNGAPLTADIEAGSLYVDWVVDFETPQINPAATVASEPGVGNSRLVETEAATWQAARKLKVTGGTGNMAVSLKEITWTPTNQSFVRLVLNGVVLFDNLSLTNQITTEGILLEQGEYAVTIATDAGNNNGINLVWEGSTCNPSMELAYE